MISSTWTNKYLCEVVSVTQCLGKVNRVCFLRTYGFQSKRDNAHLAGLFLLSGICTPLPPQCQAAISHGLHWFEIFFFTIGLQMDCVTKPFLDASSLNAFPLLWDINSHPASLDRPGDSLNPPINLSSVYHGFGLLERTAPSADRQLCNIVKCSFGTETFP